MCDLSALKSLLRGICNQSKSRKYLNAISRPLHNDVVFEHGHLSLYHGCLILNDKIAFMLTADSAGIEWKILSLYVTSQQFRFLEPALLVHSLTHYFLMPHLSLRRKFSIFSPCFPDGLHKPYFGKNVPCGVHGTSPTPSPPPRGFPRRVLEGEGPARVNENEIFKVHISMACLF